jgi:MoxR-like ATPase
VQFTPDLMPSDVLGTNVFNMKTSNFDFHAGPVFADIVLVDEINRAPAKTQAALFEVMEERQVTIDGTTHAMGSFYTILATQNPVEQEGTYKLPEAQTDRFMMKITMGYPSLDEEITILERHHANQRLTALDAIEPVISKAQLIEMRQMLGDVFVDPALLRYMAAIVQQTRQSKAVFLGASPRASVAMLQASKAFALLSGRDFVTPEDIKFVTPSILQHRLILTAEAEMEGHTALKVTQRLIDKVEVPK